MYRSTRLFCFAVKSGVFSESKHKSMSPITPTVTG